MHISSTDFLDSVFSLLFLFPSLLRRKGSSSYISHLMYVGSFPISPVFPSHFSICIPHHHLQFLLQSTVLSTALKTFSNVSLPKKTLITHLVSFSLFLLKSFPFSNLQTSLKNSVTHFLTSCLPA